MARLTRPLAALVTSLLAVLALAACGGGTSTKDKNAYAEKVNAAQTSFASTVVTVDQQSGSTTSLAHQQATLRRFKRAIDGVVADLRKIDAPSEVTNEHNRLVAVMTSFGRDIGQANDALRNPTSGGIELAKRRLRTVTQSVNTRVAAAIAAINAKLKGK
jgi:ABC-type glycerol-3-phosphate transport system substrate-binding protein